MIEQRPYRLIVPQGKVELARELAKRTKPRFVVEEAKHTPDDVLEQEWQRLARQWISDERS